MPIYEYKCKNCNKEFEELVPVNEVDNPSCPECCSENVERKMSLFGGLYGKSENSSKCGNSKFT